MCLLFAGSETALTSVHGYQWDAANVNKKTKNFKYVSKMIKNYNLSLGCVLIGNTIFSIVCSSLITLVIEGTTEGESYSHLLSLICSFVLALIVLVFAEYLPKSIARKHGVKWLKMLGIPVYIFYTLFWPLSYILDKLFGKKRNITTSEKEVNSLILNMQDEGVLEREEASLVKHALNFDELEIGHITIPLLKVIKISNSFTSEKVFDVAVKANHTRLPVLKGNSKEIMGYIIADEIFKYVIENNTKNFDWRKLIHTIPSVPPKTKLSSILRIMQRSGIKIFCVKNNNSKNALGIVTMENVIEQIVGEIYDEYDMVNKYRRINSFTWLVNGNIKAHTFMKRYFKKTKLGNMTFDEYFKKILKVKEFVPYNEYENSFMKVTLTRYEEHSPIFELIKK